jgi:hypothetical protein
MCQVTDRQLIYNKYTNSAKKVTDNHGMRFKFKIRFSGTSNNIIRMKEGKYVDTLFQFMNQ